MCSRTDLKIEKKVHTEGLLSLSGGGPCAAQVR